MLSGDWEPSWLRIVHVALISARGVVTLGLWVLGTRPVRVCV